MSDREPPEDEDGEYGENGETDPWQDLEADSETSEETDPWGAVEADDRNDRSDRSDRSDRAEGGHTAVDHGDDPSVRGDTATENESAPAAEEVFDKMGVDELDGEALWEELAGDGDAEAFDPSEGRPAVDAEPVQSSDPTETVTESTQTSTTQSSASQPGTGEPTESHTARTQEEAIVDKRKYCQQCPYFSGPPEVDCSHEGTTIVEVLFDGRFRLNNCPVVTDSGPDRTILNDGH